METKSHCRIRKCPGYYSYVESKQFHSSYWMQSNLFLFFPTAKCSAIFLNSAMAIQDPRSGQLLIFSHLFMQCLYVEKLFYGNNKQQFILKSCPPVIMEFSCTLCCHLLKRTQLTFTAWAESLYVRKDGRAKTQYLLKAWVFLTAWTSFHYSQFVGLFIYNKPEVKIYAPFGPHRTL